MLIVARQDHPVNAEMKAKIEAETRRLYREALDADADAVLMSGTPEEQQRAALACWRSVATGLDGAPAWPTR